MAADAQGQTCSGRRLFGASRVTSAASPDEYASIHLYVACARQRIASSVSGSKTWARSMLKVRRTVSPSLTHLLHRSYRTTAAGVTTVLSRRGFRSCVLQSQRQRSTNPNRVVQHFLRLAGDIDL